MAKISKQMKKKRCRHKWETRPFGSRNSFIIDKQDAPVRREEMITWELAKDLYGISEFFLLDLAIRTNKNICDANKMFVKDFWGR